jgi:hypothetical protein
MSEDEFLMLTIFILQQISGYSRTFSMVFKFIEFFPLFMIKRFYPFRQVWLCLTLTYLIAIIPLAYSDSLSIRYLIEKPGEIENMFWYVFGTFTNVSQRRLMTGRVSNAYFLELDVFGRNELVEFEEDLNENSYR